MGMGRRFCFTCRAQRATETGARASRHGQTLFRWLSEDYFIFHVREAEGTPTAADLTRDHGLQIAQVVRGDRLMLSEGECAEVLHSQISYYAHDMAVIGWNAAFLYDSTIGAETAIQLLEYANSQLLEFRHYDELLTGILDGGLRLSGAEDRHDSAVAAGQVRNEPAHGTVGTWRS